MPPEDLESIKDEIPLESPVQPVELGLDSEFRFHCHEGISCFNACCRNSDITLMPYDILRLKRRMGMTSSQWVGQYTLPFPMDAHEMPGLRLSTKPGTAECVFLEETGCSVYSDRPTACRYYALGIMGVRKQGEKAVDDIFFVVREPHCKGHEETRKLAVRDYLREQGLDEYERANRPWREIVLKKRSSGPTVGKPSLRSMQLFDMCSYDIDMFRRFFDSPGFQEVFDLEQSEQDELREDEDKLFHFACRFLKQVLFGERSIPLRPDARDVRLGKHGMRRGSEEPAHHAQESGQG